MGLVGWIQSANFRQVSEAEAHEAQEKINRRPRKRLSLSTPRENYTNRFLRHIPAERRDGRMWYNPQETFSHFTIPQQAENNQSELHFKVESALNISPSRAAIQADVEILQMLEPSRRDDVHLGLARRLENFIASILRRIEAGAKYESFAPVLEAICRAYNPGWLLLARWHMEERTQEGYARAKEQLRRFLENGPPNAEAAEAWKLLGHACYQTGDWLGEVHAFVERAQVSDVDFYDLSNTANRLSQFLRVYGLEIDRDQKRDLAARIISVLKTRRAEADADDLSGMAWLAIHSGQEALARELVEAGLAKDGDNYHIVKLAQRLGLHS